MYKNRSIKKEYHGMTKTRSYRCWYSMMERCYNPKSKGFRLYGARGIRVCRRWHTFSNFFADMGVRPKGRTLDRTENDGPYSPNNCRWATSHQQTRNMRSNHYLVAFGARRTITDWIAITGLSHVAIRGRLKAGFTPEQALDRRRGFILGKRKVKRTRWGKAQTISR